MKKDLRVEVRFKNNNLYKKIFGQFGSVAEFCRKTDLDPGTVGEYLNLKNSPVSRTNNRHTEFVYGYHIKKSARKIATALKCNIFDIFPVELFDVVSKVYAFEVCSCDHLPYDEQKQIESIDTGLDDTFNADEIDRVLSTLSPREEAVIRNRFGIGTDLKTLEAVSLLNGVSRERVRQIEGSALRKLRHPVISRKLIKHKTL